MIGLGALARGSALVGAGAVLVASGGGWYLTSSANNEVQRISVFSEIPATERPTVDPRAGDSLNVLIVGSDNRSGLSRADLAKYHLGFADYGNTRTDTMIIVHIGKDTSHITAVGLPRDSYVTIPDCKSASTGQDVPEHKSRINEAFSLGGPKCMIRTVEKATNIKIDHYVEVNFKAFTDMVDAIGGVEVCLPTAIKDNPKYTNLNLPAGQSLLDGKTALDFVRSRHSTAGSDFDRIKRQQQFIASMLSKALSAGILLRPDKLNNFISAALRNTKVDSGLDQDAIFALAQRLQGINLKSIEFPQIPISNGNWDDPATSSNDSYVLWNDVGSKALFDAIRTDSAITAEASGKAPKPTVPVGDISVTVSNASGVTGVGRTASSALKQIGFVIGASPSTAKRVATTTVIRFDPAYSESLKTVQAAYPGVSAQPLVGLGKTFRIVIGSDNPSPVKPKISAPQPGGIKADTANNVVCPA